MRNTDELNQEDIAAASKLAKAKQETVDALNEMFPLPYTEDELDQNLSKLG